ncbi:DNA primase [Sphingomonas desiccabilis]|uniref:DNA primase n=1 Tax=Sphingomonas desiccabilis TaxID=429134 RepID=A0A4Q2IWT8_9SPHN|nr:DNA primase [Sphingomonas desiccabilis]MBB3910445.1 DNA primase [Sphingomonas desiccabilis]RXZ35095.1 DNA primase [Sphingomonas desiccabilis]
MSLSPQFLDELRARTVLSALIGKSVKLQRAGREWRACCPFHNEKTPSFYVNDDKGFYHCFGCSAHGDAIRWMTDQQGLPFIDAVKELAQAAGLEVPAQDRRSAERAERAKGLHDAMEEASRWFTEQLHGLAGAEARAALERRGISAGTARSFGLGYSPDSRGKLKEALASFGDPMLVEAGLLIQVEDKAPYDRFRGRLMIPIRDARGRVIAFGGRVIGDGEPKYLNSPETPLFDKGRTLFNLDRAQAAARKAGRVIAVEGYMDVIALAQAGFGEAVAPLGTAMTEAQLERLWRMSDVPILCFDGDAAGQKAAIRAAHRALPLLGPGRSLSFVTLPQGQDPDDLVRSKGPGAFETLLREPEPLVERLWKQELAAEPLTTPENRAGLKRRLGELARTIGDPMVRDEYLSEFRNRCDEAFAPPERNRQWQGGGGGSWQRGSGGQPRGGNRPGQRGGWRPPEPPPSDTARQIAQGIDPVLAKAVVAGLIRHPAQIARHLEVLGSLRLADGALGRLFEAVVDVALADRQLDSGGVRTILAKSGFNDIANELLRADTLPFSFTRHDGDDEARAVADLDEAIAVLVTRPAVDAALAEATAALQAGLDETAFERQVALVQEQEALKARLANLVLADEDD